MRRIISKVVQKLFGRRKAPDRAAHSSQAGHAQRATHPAHGSHGHKGARKPPAPVVVKREEHTLSRSRIDEDALKVLNRLVRNHHAAFLVGGGVRDLLLDRAVKDFDIATSAHPQEIKHLFRNCRLIGRRFRLAHILFRGGKTIEVSTFRKQTGFSDEGDDLLIKSDNTFGTPEEDALRRDFTINGLFYSITDFSVIDFVDGLKDLKLRLIRTIGDPNIRLREDPIRTLRGIRLAARLGFEIETGTREAMTAHLDEIWKCAAPRIVDEFVRMLNQGAAAASFPLLAELGVLEGLLPVFAKAYAKPEIRARVQRNLTSLDAHQKPQRGLPPGLALAVLYHPLLTAAVAAAPPDTDPGKIASELLDTDLGKLKFPRAQLEKAVLLLGGQQRLTQPRRRRGRGRGGALAARSWFAEALTLFEITQADTPAGRETLRQLRAQQLRAASEQRPLEGDEPPPEGGAGDGPGTEPVETTEQAGRTAGGRRRRRSRRGQRRGRGRKPTVNADEEAPAGREGEPEATREREPQARRARVPEEHRRVPKEDHTIDPDAAFGDSDSDLEPPGGGSSREVAGD